MTKTAKMPTPVERPDLYDHHDCTDRPMGTVTGIRIPDHILKACAEHDASKQKVAAE